MTNPNHQSHPNTSLPSAANNLANSPQAQPVDSENEPLPWEDADRETQSQAGAEPAEPSQFIVQRNGRLGHFTLVRQLGGGGFGHVYLAWDNRLRREVAIKVPRWDRPLTARTQDRFLHEGRMLAQVHHPAIAAVHEVGVTDDGLPFVVMNYVKGQSLSQILKQTLWTSEQKLQVLIQIADTLQQAHKQGLTHRDLKPANIIVDDQLRISLVDFGLALHDDLAPSQLGEGSVMGTPVYMAPEQVRGENHLIDGRTDVWALGVIMYLMLTQRLPFASRDHRELVRSICYKNPRPLRQLDDQIPKELERICLRCLQKLMEDRYPSMADVRDELQAFVADSQQQFESQLQVAQNLNKPTVQMLQSLSPADVPGTPSSKQGGEADRPSGPSHPSHLSQPSHPSGTPSVTRSLIEVVPRGLAAFDQSDSEFFLQLLPGPYDRNGIPQSLRFLLSRLSGGQPIDAVPLIVVYGPSGSGKSSLIRAGLLSRLPTNVVPVYFDCTTSNLPQKLRDRLQREFVTMSPDTNLPELFRQVRQGQHLRDNDKLVLILDQFEQWLRQPEALEPSELTEALRQCEASRVQVVLLVRDDYWMTLSLFLKQIDQRIEDGRNALIMPLLDERHARRVLEMFGRAFGSLPAGLTPLNRAQSKFLEHAVAAIAQHGKVICVHLVVLAETIKDRDWGRQDYHALGGWGQIGREYIAGIFNNPQTPPFVKKHAEDAWRILKALLPQGNDNLKGQALTLPELQEQAGLVAHGNRFQELLKFLEHDARLISPLEDEDWVEASDGAQQSQGGNSLMGLTHDFLVGPIRTWGQAIQKETAAGRAEHLLQHLAMQWELTGDTRFLPSLTDYLRMVWHTGRSQRQALPSFWTAASQRNRNRLIAIALTLTMLVVGAWLVQREVSRARSRNQADIMLHGPSSSAIQWVDQLPQMNRFAKDLFTELPEPSLPRLRLRANGCLLAADPQDQKRLEALLQDLAEVEPAEFELTRAVLQTRANQILPHLVQFCQRADLTVTQRSRAAILAQMLGDYGPVMSVSRLQADANWRSQLIEDWIDCVARFDGPLIRWPAENQLETGDFWQAFFTAASRSVNASRVDQQLLAKVALAVYHNHPHAGAHAAAKHFLAKTQVTFESPPQLALPEAQWRYLTLPEAIQGRGNPHLLFVQIPAGLIPRECNDPGLFQFIPQIDGKIERPFWMGSSEVMLELFETFRKAMPADDLDLAGLAKHKEYQALVNAMHPDSAASYVDLYQSISFCNWISKQLGYEEVYERDDQLFWRALPHRVGFRLPTWEEAIRAQRAESTTKFYFGDSRDRLNTHLEGYWKVTDTRAERYPPNGFGLFDISGNVSEWLAESAKMRVSAVVWFDQGFQMGGYRADSTGVVESGNTTGIMAQTKLSSGFRLVFTGEKFSR